MPLPLSSAEALGRAVAAGRMLLGLDQAQLATEAGVSAATVSNVERGNDARPDTMKALRKALRQGGVTLCFDAKNGHASATIAFEEPEDED
jgi:transcriptional regulator with XRE-family HTH domain